MNNKKIKQKRKGKEEKRLIRVFPQVTYIFLWFMVVIFPVYMDNKYFNITATRADLFVMGGLLFLIFGSIALLFEALQYSGLGQKMTNVIPKDEKWYLRTEFWFLLFLLANLLGLFAAEDRMISWEGSAGRFMGAKMYVVLILVSIYLMLGTKISKWLYAALGVMVIAAVLLSVFQHFGVDLFSLREKITEETRRVFISFFGNRNVYGTFLGLMFGVFAGVLCFTEIKWMRRMALAVLFFIGMGIIPAKSDNVFLAVGTALVFLYFASALYGKLENYIHIYLPLAAGFFIPALFTDLRWGAKWLPSGIIKLVYKWYVAGAVLLLVLGLYAALLVLQKKGKLNLKKKADKKYVLYSWLVIGGVLVLLLLFLAAADDSLFIFDTKWGSGRGYVWSRCVMIFNRAPIVNKLFGYGNETLKIVMQKNFSDELNVITKILYDNAHNELLQYLVTLGIFGLTTYGMALVMGVRYMWNAAKKSEDVRPAVMACLGGCAAYFASSLISISQPITTPMFFCLLGAGIGVARMQKKD